MFLFVNTGENTNTFSLSDKSCFWRVLNEHVVFVAKSLGQLQIADGVLVFEVGDSERRAQELDVGAGGEADAFVQNFQVLLRPRVQVQKVSQVTGAEVGIALKARAPEAPLLAFVGDLHLQAQFFQVFDGGCTVAGGRGGGGGRLGGMR